MKKPLFTTVFALISLGIYAQKADEEAIRKLGADYLQAAVDRDLTAWLKGFAQTADLTFGFNPNIPNYVLHGYDKLAEFGKASITRNPNRLPVTYAQSNYRFRIRGNTAFVTFLETATTPDGSQRQTQVADYLEKENGQWKMVAHLFGRAPESKPTDEETIRKLCNAQTEAWHRRDTPAMVAINAPVPYSSRYWATADGWIGAINGSDQINQTYTDLIKKSPQPMNVTSVQSNWQLKPLGENYYWATYDQVSTGADGKVNRSKEVRLLEKINEQWKMVSVITLPLTKV